ncbi:MAG TPA: DMT family transporter [Sphingobium sp.]|uniref:DMT family transporter n=1 Tax=Sphingobium sp. TaxID=1912891 RepID=UPI002ED17F7F
MMLAIALALLNGGMIALSRTLNGALGRKVGAVRSSFWNHSVGFAFMSLVVLGASLLTGTSPLPISAPLTAWLGGVVGVIFVAINSYVIVRLGASRTTSFVVGAQMLTGVAISSIAYPLDGRFALRLAGAGIVIAGIALANSRREPAAAAPVEPVTGAGGNETVRV